MSRSFRLRTLIGGVSVAAIVLGFAIQMRASALRQARQSACDGNLSRITTALVQYNDYFGVLPPAYTTDKHGRRLHSWRVLLLPFIDRGDLYARFALDQPWDSAYNSRLLHKMPPEYQCHNDTTAKPWETSYLVAVASKTAFPGKRAFSLSGLKKPLSELALVAEVHRSRISWSEPNDIDLSTVDLNDLIAQLHEQSHSDPDGAGIGIADGTAVRLHLRRVEIIVSMFFRGPAERSVNGEH